MIKKLAAFIVLTFLVVPYASLAQSPAGAGKSIENLSAADVADDSIVVLSSEETGVAGYVHQKYAFLCLGEVAFVDHYGAPIDSNDQSILLREQQICAKRQLDDDTSED